MMGKWHHAQKIETSYPEKVKIAQIPWLGRFSSTAFVINNSEGSGTHSPIDPTIKQSADRSFTLLFAQGKIDRLICTGGRELWLKSAGLAASPKSERLAE